MYNESKIKIIKYAIHDMTQLIIDSTDGHGLAVLNAMSESGFHWTKALYAVNLVTEYLLKDKTPRETAILTMALMNKVSDIQAALDIDWYNDNKYNDIRTVDTIKYQTAKYIEELIVAFGICRLEIYTIT